MDVHPGKIDDGESALAYYIIADKVYADPLLPPAAYEEKGRTLAKYLVSDLRKEGAVVPMVVRVRAFGKDVCAYYTN